MSTTTIDSTSDATVVSAAGRVQLELDLLTARLRRDVWIYGLLAVAATAVGMLLVMMIADAIFQPETTALRFVLWISILAASGAATHRFVWKPLQDRCNALALAWSIEEQRPELQETLTSTLLLGESNQPAAASLVNAVAAQANRNLADCRDDAATRRDVRVPGFAAAGFVVVAAFCLAVWPQYLMPSLSNVMAPWKTRQLPCLTAVISPGHIAIAEGEALEVSALGQGLDHAVLEIMSNDEVLSTTPMNVPANHNEASVLLPDLNADQSYRVRSGSLVSDVYQVTVHPRPILTEAKATLQFPAYTGIEPETVADFSAPITTVAGTRVRLSVATIISISEAGLTVGDQQPKNVVSEKNEDAWQHHWNLETDERPVLTAHVQLISEHDVPGEPFSFEIQSVPDQPPTLSINTPTLENLTLEPDGQLPISFEAADDFGVRAVEVLIQKQGAQPERIVVAQDLETDNHTAEYVFDPQVHDLKIGDELTLWLVAADNRTPEYGGTQVAESRKLMITVAEQSLSVGGQQVTEERDRLQDALSDAIDRLHAAHENAEQIADSAEQAGADDAKVGPTDVTADAQELQTQLQEARQALENLASSNEKEAGLFDADKQQIRKIADEEIEEAQQQARMIPLTSDPAEQQQTAETARAAIQQAQEQLKALKEQIANRAAKLQQAAELDELARQQNEFARQMEEQKPAPQAEPKQEQIADRLQKLTENDPEAESEQFLQRANTAEKLAKKTDQLQEQQHQLATAAKSKTDEETRDQLARMIKAEQKAIADDNQRFMDGAQQDKADPAKEKAAAEAQQFMQQVSEDLDKNKLQAAKQNAERSKQKLQEAATPQAAADNGQQEPQAVAEKRDRLAKRQERIEEAIREVEENDFEAARKQLQELITDRVEEVAKEAEELLELPTDEEENQKISDEAKQKLQEALKDSKQASRNSDDRQAEDQQKNAAAKQNEAGDKNAQPQQQQNAEKQAEQQQQPGQREKRDGQPQTQPKGDQKKNAATQQNEAGDKNAQPQQQQKAEQQAEQQQQEAGAKQQPPRKQPPNQQNKKHGQPQAQQSQNAEPKDKPNDQQQAKKKKQQDKAAKSLKQASESLKQFCKSCRQCANCNKSGNSGSSSGSSSPTGNQPEGKQSSQKQTGDKQNANKQPGGKKNGNKQNGQGDQKKHGVSKQLAKTTDDAQKAARKPTPAAAKQVAKKLDKLADRAAQESGYSQRKGNKGRPGSKNNGAEKKQQKTDGKNGKPTGGKSASGEPKGVGPNGQPDDADAIATQLRGPSSSEWTRSHKRLRGSVLDRKSTQIPEAFRGVVEDYFEQLSKIDSDDSKPEVSK